MTDWLTPAEVGELTATKPKAWRAQRMRLVSMGFPFTPNYVGRPLVERAAVFHYRERAKAVRGPNWGALDEPSTKDATQGAAVLPRRQRGRTARLDAARARLRASDPSLGGA